MFKAIISIIFLATAVILFFVWSQPLFHEVKDLMSQSSSFDEALSTSRQIQEKREGLLSQYNAISQESLNRLNKLLPSQPDSIKFILEIEKIAQQNGLIIKDIDLREAAGSEQKTSSEAKEKLFDSIPVAMKMVGSYKSFYSFLRDIERNLRLMDINALSFIVAETDFYEFNIEGLVYWEK
ncbi:MAG: type 4a pilus biogenesis protein PilO [Candidatus Terrybacteria bacterium]|nr:type 4a pilus biogenesis protein PilO [Candidatus Terrybacteria bacterium]